MKKRGGGGFGGFLWVLAMLAAAGFGYAMFHFQESPEQVWKKITNRIENFTEPAPTPAPTPAPLATPTPTPAPTATPVPVVEAPKAEPDVLAWLLSKKERWPEQVTLLKATDFPAVVRGKVAGTVKVPAGREVQLVEITRQSLGVVYNGGGVRVPIEVTDLLDLATIEMNSPEPAVPAPTTLAQPPATPSPRPQPTPALAEKAAAKSRPFVHPGLLHTEADFERMRAKVKAGKSPWIEGWQKLTESRHAQLNWGPRPTEKVTRGGSGQNFPVLFNDIAAAYQLALRWKVSGDEAYADKSVAILNGWGATLQEVTGNADRFLAAGIYGYQLANAAEIMRTYSGWKKKDFARFQEMMLRVFYPMNQSFLFGRDGGQDHNGAAITNYWANWDLCNIASMQAIGVLCDRRDIYDQAVNYFLTGRGNGVIDKAVYYVHPGYLGQWQEAGRDQGHTTLGIALMEPICEAAWNQGTDLYGHDNNRFLAGAEYVAKYNLGHDVPFQSYIWGTGPRGDRREQTQISGGPGAFRAGYELVVNHYVNRRGIAAPYSAQFAARLRPEGAPGGHASSFDQVGLGTLTETLESQVTNPAPSGLTARQSGATVILSWWGAAGATSYQVKRAPAGGPYAVIADGVKDLLTYGDQDLPPGAYSYVVTGVRDGKETPPSNAVQISTVPTLHLHLRFDRLVGTTAPDAVNSEHPGMLHGGAKRDHGRTGNAVALDGKDDYVSLPGGLVSGLSDFTIAAWVYVDSAQPWARVFDFGDNRGHYMFLTADGGGGKPRFGVSTVYGYNEQSITSAEALPTGQWVHLAVTLSGRVGTIYVDGVAAGSNSSIDFPPFRLGTTSQNWIGRSQFPHDPYFNGKVDDFRIYNHAFPANAIRDVFQRRN